MTKRPKTRTKRSADDKAAYQDAVAAIRNARSEIIENLIQKAKEGNCQTAKWLFEYAGLLPGAAESAEESAFSDELLRQLREAGLRGGPEVNATGGAADESI